MILYIYIYIYIYYYKYLVPTLLNNNNHVDLAEGGLRIRL